MISTNHRFSLHARHAENCTIRLEWPPAGCRVHRRLDGCEHLVTMFFLCTICRIAFSFRRCHWADAAQQILRPRHTPQDHKLRWRCTLHRLAGMAAEFYRVALLSMASNNSLSIKHDVATQARNGFRRLTTKKKKNEMVVARNV